MNFFTFLTVLLFSLLGFFCFNFNVIDKDYVMLCKIHSLFFIPVFLLHKFFNCLTKKFPTPFEQIGYYTSIECLSDFFNNNHKNKQQTKKLEEFEEQQENKKKGFISKLLKSENMKFTLKVLISCFIFYFLFVILYEICMIFVIYACYSPISIFSDIVTSQNYLNHIFIVTILFIVAVFLATYLYLKIFGILKQSDKLNTFFVLFIFLLGIGINYIYLYLTHSPDIFFYTMEFFGFILVLFLHKFFNFLTKKYPIPFEQIGYYTSIEFVKDLLRPIVKRIKK